MFHFRPLFVIGSILIFSAWLIQNFQEAEFKSKREILIEKQATINNLFAARRIWLESLYTHRAIKNDSVKNDEVYYVKAYNYLETTLSTLSHIDEVLISDTLKLKKELEKYAKTLEVNGEYFKNKEYEKLIQTVNYINAGAYNVNKKFSESGEKERKLLSEITSNEKKANRHQLWFYILGSILIAIDYLAFKIKTLPNGKDYKI